MGILPVVWLKCSSLEWVSANVTPCYTESHCIIPSVKPCHIEHSHTHAHIIQCYINWSHCITLCTENDVIDWFERLELKQYLKSFIQRVRPLIVIPWYWLWYLDLILIFTLGAGVQSAQWSCPSDRYRPTGHSMCIPTSLSLSLSLSLLQTIPQTK